VSFKVLKKAFPHFEFSLGMKINLPFQYLDEMRC
jgi:hypothetical protein